MTDEPPVASPCAEPLDVKKAPNARAIVRSKALLFVDDALNALGQMARGDAPADPVRLSVTRELLDRAAPPVAKRAPSTARATSARTVRPLNVHVRRYGSTDAQ